MTHWTRALRENGDAIIAGGRERKLTPRTVADGIAVRRVIKSPSSAAVDWVIDVVTKAVAADKDSASSAQTRTAPTLLLIDELKRH